MSRKPFVSLVAIPAASLLLTFGAAACGSGSSNDATIVQAAATPQFLSESADRTAAVESGRFEMRIEVPASSEVPDGFAIKGSGAFDLATQRSQTTIDLSELLDAAKSSDDSAAALALFGDGKFDIISDTESVYINAGFLTAFLGGTDGKPWVKVPADEAGVGDQLTGGLTDATALLDLLRDQGATVTDEGEADVQGESTHHFSATISVKDALASAPADSQDKAKELIDQLGADAADTQLPLDVYVDGEGYVRRMQMTIDGGAFASLAGSEADAPTGPMSFTIDFLDLGEAVDIALPPADQVADGSKLGEAFGQSGD